MEEKVLFLRLRNLGFGRGDKCIIRSNIVIVIVILERCFVNREKGEINFSIKLGKIL